MEDNKDNFEGFRISVPKEFEEVFTHFYFAENTSADTIVRTLLPTYQTILVFNFGANALLYTQQNTQITLDKCLVLGPIKRAFSYSLPPQSQILVATFKGDAFYRFFGTAAIAEHLPQHPGDLLEENCFTALWTALNQLDNTTLQIDYILEFCRPYLKEGNLIAQQLSNFQDKNLNPIKSVANQQQQTERNIQLNHKKYLGYTAKELSRYQRFLKAVELLQYIASEAAKPDWFEIISICGYYDQSQLIHDFKHYLNLSPTKYLKFQQEICSGKA